MTDDEILAAAVELLQRRAAPRAASTTVAALYKRWSDAHGSLASFKTEQGRAALLLAWAPKDGPFAAVTLGDRDPTTLTAGDVDMFRADQRQRRTRRKAGTTPATRNRFVMLLQRWLNFAASRGTIARNPIKAVEPEREAPSRDVVVTEDGIARILAAIESRLVQAWTIVAFESGMRRGEMLKLCWRQLDGSGGVIHIPGEHTKSRKARDVEYPPRSRAAVEALPRVIGCAEVFANPETRRPYDGRWIHELFIRGVDASGVTGAGGKPPRLHDLRRSYVTLMRKRGVQESVVMKFSGHADAQVFRRYNIVEQDDLDAARAKNAAGRAADLAAIKQGRDDSASR